MDDIYAKLVELNKSRVKSTLCVLISTSGSVPRKAGAKMIVSAAGDLYGTIGGGKVEQQVKKRALEIMGGVKPETLRINLENDAEMHCGGAVEVYLEPSVPASELYIFGAGHVGAALASMAKNFNFDVTIVDHRKELLAPIEADGVKVIPGVYEEIAAKTDSGENTYLVVATPKHESDIGTTAILVRKNFKYLGMIGSKKKVIQAVSTFKNQHISEALINNIDMPIGLPFNAQTPQEIAISILAKLIDVRNS